MHRSATPSLCQSRTVCNFSKIIAKISALMVAGNRHEAPMQVISDWLSVHRLSTLAVLV
jgi:hypothetical protein